MMYTLSGNEIGVIDSSHKYDSLYSVLAIKISIPMSLIRIIRVRIMDL